MMSHKNDGCKKIHRELNPATSKKRKVEPSESCKQQSKAGSRFDSQEHLVCLYAICCACMSKCRYTRPFPTLYSPSHYEIDTRTWQSIAAISWRYTLKRTHSDAVSSRTGAFESTQRNNISPFSEQTAASRICWRQSRGNTSFKVSVPSMVSCPQCRSVRSWARPT